MNTKRIQGFVPKEGLRKDADPFKPRAATPFVPSSPFQPANMNANMPMGAMGSVPVIVQSMPAQPGYPIAIDPANVPAFVPTKNAVAINSCIPMAPPTPKQPTPVAPKHTPAPAAPKPAPVSEKPTAPAKPAAPATPAMKEQPTAKPSRPAPVAPAAPKLNLMPQRRSSVAERKISMSERRPMISEERLAELVSVAGERDA